MDTHKNIQLRPDTSDPIPNVGSDPVLQPVPVGKLPDSMSLGSPACKMWKARNRCEDQGHAGSSYESSCPPVPWPGHPCARPRRSSPYTASLGAETLVPGPTLSRSLQLSWEGESGGWGLAGGPARFLGGCAFRLVIRRPAGSAGPGLITV